MWIRSGLACKAELDQKWVQVHAISSLMVIVMSGNTGKLIWQKVDY